MDIERVLDDLERWEGNVSWLYRDSAPAGNVTIGIGCLVPDEHACVALPLARFDTKPASVSEKLYAWEAIRRAPPALRASAYEKLTSLRLRETHARDLARKKLETEFLPRLRWLCHGFDRYPEPVQRALIDMAWNLGTGGLARFYNMLAACDRRDWEKAAGECRRRTARDERNDWTAALFREAAVVQSDQS